MKTLLSYIAIMFLFTMTETTMNLNNDKSQLSIFGTSSIHDWEIEAEQCHGTAVLVYENEELKTIKSLSFEVVVDELESGKSSMDGNTVEALKGDKYPKVLFQLSDIKSIEPNGSDKLIKAVGELTIAGVTKVINMDVILETHSNSVVIRGEKSLKMTDFKIDPPTAVFGTITTGDEVNIKFKINYSK